ncbi:hypothetical protein [Lysobacter sp. Hz 25]|uniref:hypothetical protein n=1 Tax=Lysobacter sp. Hz 25 TaxID=3383698 RepID=UPI0038D50DAF
MGIHVTYHPFAPAEVNSMYFDLMSRDASIERLALQLGLDPDASTKLKTLLLNGGRARPGGMSLSQTHAHNMAKVSGLLRNCWYTGNCRFSALEAMPDFGQYMTDWRDLMLGKIVRGPSRHESVVPGDDRILFLSCEALRRLRADAAEHGAMRSQLNRVFPRGWLPIFWEAADHAVASDCGLIEAVDLVRPDIIAPSSLMA